MKAKLFKLENDDLILDLPELDLQLTFEINGQVTYSAIDVSELEPIVFESEIYSRIENAIEFSQTIPSVEFLVGIKALIADKVYDNEI